MGTIPERATPYRRTSADFDRILSQSWFRLPDVGDDSVNVELNNGRLSFVAQEKVAGTVAVHKSVLSERCSTGSVAEDVESSFLICVTVRVIEAHQMTGQVLQGGTSKIAKNDEMRKSLYLCQRKCSLAQYFYNAMARKHAVSALPAPLC